MSGLSVSASLLDAKTRYAPQSLQRFCYRPRRLVPFLMTFVLLHTRQLQVIVFCIMLPFYHCLRFDHQRVTMKITIFNLLGLSKGSFFSSPTRLPDLSRASDLAQAWSWTHPNQNGPSYGFDSERGYKPDWRKQNQDGYAG